MGNCSSAVANEPQDAQSLAVEEQLKQMEVRISDPARGKWGWGGGGLSSSGPGPLGTILPLSSFHPETPRSERGRFHRARQAEARADAGIR